jgi:hypothetical protein
MDANDELDQKTSSVTSPFSIASAESSTPDGLLTVLCLIKEHYDVDRKYSAVCKAVPAGNSLVVLPSNAPAGIVMILAIPSENEWKAKVRVIEEHLSKKWESLSNEEKLERAIFNLESGSLCLRAGQNGNARNDCRDATHVSQDHGIEHRLDASYIARYESLLVHDECRLQRPRSSVQTLVSNNEGKQTTEHEESKAEMTEIKKFETEIEKLETEI